MRSSIIGLLLKWPCWLRLDQIEIRSQELLLGLPESALDGSWNWEPETGLETRYSDINSEHLSRHLQLLS